MSHEELQEFVDEFFDDTAIIFGQEREDIKVKIYGCTAVIVWFLIKTIMVLTCKEIET